MHETVAAQDIDIPNHHIQSQTGPDIYLHIETHTFAPDPLKEVGYMYEKSTEEIQCFCAPELGLEPRTL